MGILLCLFVPLYEGLSVPDRLWNLEEEKPDQPEHHPHTPRKILPLHKGGNVWSNVWLDGVPMDAIPEVFLPVAVLHDRMSSSSKGLSRSTRDSSVTAYCQTEACVQLMAQYNQWRLDNGYPDNYGKWGWNHTLYGNSICYRRVLVLIYRKSHLKIIINIVHVTVSR